MSFFIKVDSTRGEEVLMNLDVIEKQLKDPDPDSPYNNPAALNEAKTIAIDLIRYIKDNDL